MQRCRLLNLLTGWRLCGCRHAEQSAGNDWLSAGRPQCGPLLSTFRLERSPKWPPSAETAASHSRSVDIAVSIRQIPCETYRPAPISVLVPPEWHQKGGKEEAPPPPPGSRLSVTGWPRYTQRPFVSRKRIPDAPKRCPLQLKSCVSLLLLLTR